MDHEDSVGQKLKRTLGKAADLLGLGESSDLAGSVRSSDGGSEVKVLKKGPAMRVIFFYPGEEGTYVDNADVTLFDNGIVHIRSHQEETTTHLQNCEILWRFEVEAEDRANKVRLLKPRSNEESPKASPTSPSQEPTL